MGGIGSRRSAVDEFLSVDLRILRRNGALVDGRISVIQWLRRDRCIGEYQVTADNDQLIINCSGQGFIQRVQLTHTACHLGGQRPWMACPECRSRVMLLYVAAAGLCCRHCLNLTYPSRNEGHVDQLYRRVRNARLKVGAVADLTKPIPPKQKWKHHLKYNRLRQKAEEYEERFFGSLDEKLCKQRNL